MNGTWWRTLALPGVLTLALFGCGNQNPGTTGGGQGGSGNGGAGGAGTPEQPRQPGQLEGGQKAGGAQGSGGTTGSTAPEGNPKGTEGEPPKNGGSMNGNAGSKAGDPPQRVSPVSGKPIDKNVYLDYDGKRIYFADDAEKRTFIRNPDKYMQQMRESGVTLEPTPEQQKGTTQPGGTEPVVPENN